MNGMLILVPTLNEQLNIERAVRAIAKALPDARILIIDDDSKDGTWQTAEGLRGEFPQLDVMVRRNVTAGLGYSIRDGYRYAVDRGFDEVCIVDCDLQQLPEDVGMLRKFDPAADIVVGSRYLRKDLFRNGYNTVDKYLSVFCNRAMNVMFLCPYSDISTDFYVIRTRVLELIPPEMLTCMGFAFFSEIKLRAHKAGFHIVETPAPTYTRDGGASKRSYRQVMVFARQILGLWIELTFSRRHPQLKRTAV